MTSAKALGGGLPIGALITGERLADVFAARRPRLDLRRRSGRRLGGAGRARHLLGLRRCWRAWSSSGERLRAGLASLACVASVRGRGLMVGIDVADGVDAPEVGAAGAARAAAGRQRHRAGDDPAGAAADRLRAGDRPGGVTVGSAVGMSDWQYLLAEETTPAALVAALEQHLEVQTAARIAATAPTTTRSTRWRATPGCRSPTRTAASS